MCVRLLALAAPGLKLKLKLEKEMTAQSGRESGTPEIVAFEKIFSWGSFLSALIFG